MKQLVDEISKYPSIVVTGPHRAGTTIAAKIIAQELGCNFEIEATIERLKGWNLDEFQKYLFEHSTHAQFVIQGASAFRWLPHMIDWDGTAFVCIHRPLKEIMNSRMRAGLKNIQHPDRAYEDWDKISFEKDNCFDLNYHDLEGHELFCNDREGWKPRQISPGEKEVTAVI